MRLINYDNDSNDNYVPSGAQFEYDCIYCVLSAFSTLGRYVFIFCPCMCVCVCVWGGGRGHGL